MDKMWLRYIGAGLLVLSMAIVFIFMIKDYNNMFTQRVVVTYPDKCQEVYINNNLTTPECTAGRALAKEYEDRQKWYLQSTKNWSMNLS